MTKSQSISLPLFLDTHEVFVIKLLSLEENILSTFPYIEILQPQIHSGIKMHSYMGLSPNLKCSFVMIVVLVAVRQNHSNAASQQSYYISQVLWGGNVVRSLSDAAILL